MKDIYLFNLVIGIAGILLVVISSAIAGCIAERDQQVYDERIGIASLDRDMMVEGHFTLGTGSVESIPSYFYYVQLPNGGYKLNTIPASRCTIFMDENNNPYILAHYYKSASSNSYSDFGSTGSSYIIRTVKTERVDEFGDKYIRITASSYYLNGDVEIHIPEDSLIKQYNP